MTMEAINHLPFIVGSYAAAFVVVARHPGNARGDAALRRTRRATDGRSKGEGVSAAAKQSANVRRIFVLAPLAVFLALAALFLIGLNLGDPSILPSALIGRQAPDTKLPPISGLDRDGAPIPGLDTADFKGAVTIVNVWASWCVPCHDEAPLLMQLAKDNRVRLVGINYKDDPDNARRFLGRYGDPFAATGADKSGRAAIEWGVYGVPETFVVGRDARVAYKLVGPITPDNLESLLKPQIDKAVAAGS
jgi:cytochrome c biogenesis protein CcmG/thiol:disulfide interchange protein DsbE